MPYAVQQELLQFAREVTPGTDLAATAQMLVNSFKAVPKDEYYRPPVVRGLMQRYRGYETPVKRYSEWSVEAPVTYEQLQYWLSSAVVAVAAPTGAGPYVWTFTRNPAAIPTLTTHTFERKVTNGSTPIQQAWHYGLTQEIEFSFVDGQPLMMIVNGAARRIQAETATGSLSLPTPEIPVAPLATVFIDSTYGGIGGTQVTSQVLSAKVKFKTGAAPIWTADGRTDLDYTLHGIDPDQVQIEASIVCLVGAQFSTEKTAAEAGTLRAVRLAFAGSSSRALTIDFLAKHEMASIFEFGESDGQKIVEFKLVESTDGTNLIVATLTNNIAAYV